MSEESLSRRALAISDPHERAAFLDRACAGQPQLRAAVEARLAGYEAASAAPTTPAIPLPETTTEHTPEVPGLATTAPESPANAFCQPPAGDGAVVAGRYTLVEKLGEGGMGEVWVAWQTEPVKRKVALKLIKAGMDSRAVLQRFEAERQALALMDHPNIARVFDGGMTDERRPFFVMELVGGKPLSQFCDEAKLGVRARLELLVAVCSAVQHAHQKGIIHRDLKPSNILATLIDGKPVPKVIDFGVAKAVGGKLTDDSMATQFGAVMGTLEYMAPEQAGFMGDDIDTRADIYSLGVILYELLTGLRPFDSRRLAKLALPELIRVIQEEEPPKPSARLAADASSPALAGLRQTEPKKLAALLGRELDWVAMKCLEKKRERRYETANGLARDLERYLANEPMEARPPSVGYRLRKFAARHKAAVAIAVVVLLALASGVAALTTAFILVWDAQKKATETADASVAVVHDLTGYVQSFESGSGATAMNDAERERRLGSALASYERLLVVLPNDPALRLQVARMRLYHAHLNLFLAKMAEAEVSYRKGIDLTSQLIADYPDNKDYLETKAHILRDYSLYLERLGRHQEGAKMEDECARLFEELTVADPDESRYKRFLANLLMNRADKEYQVGRLAESEQAGRKSAELYTALAETPGTRSEPVDPLFHAMAHHNLAMTLREEGRIDDALAAHDRAVQLIAGLTKISNSRDAWSFYYRVRTERARTLALVSGRAEEAIKELESAIAGWDRLIKLLGDNPNDLERKSVASMYCARIKMQLGQREAAAKDATTAADIMERLVAKQPEIPVYRYDLGRAYTALGQLTADPVKAAERYRKAREMLDAAIQQYPENVLYRQALKELDVLPGSKP
jgi:tetratricopeptide (TPR) repeat protein/tRNA A-37 threonylcarbamoyl transferase component Bud32